MTRRIKVGDVFCFPISNGLVFIQFLGKHPLMGECVLCCKSDSIDRADFSKGKIFFYPVKLNFQQQNIEFVMNLMPIAAVPTKIRRPFVSNQKVKYWFIDTFSETEKVEDLSTEQMAYPIGSGLSHTVLKEILEGKSWFLFDTNHFN